MRGFCAARPAKGKRAAALSICIGSYIGLGLEEAARFYASAAPSNGHVAEWLRRGLQILAPRFDSGRGLHPPSPASAGYGGQALRTKAARRSSSAGGPFILCKAVGLCYRPVAEGPGLFPGSSAVERSTVNRNVAGSIPAQGAKFFALKFASTTRARQAQPGAVQRDQFTGSDSRALQNRDFARRCVPSDIARARGDRAGGCRSGRALRSDRRFLKCVKMRETVSLVRPR